MVDIDHKINKIKQRAMSAFAFKVRNKNYQSSSQKVTGEKILQIVGLSPAEDYELFFKVKKREFEPIQLNEIVDLSLPGLEKFTIRRRIEIPYLLDDERFSTYECLITPTEILKENGYDPAGYYLKEVSGHSQISYKSDVDHLISLRPNTKFITCKKAATPVS